MQSCGAQSQQIHLQWGGSVANPQEGENRLLQILLQPVCVPNPGQIQPWVGFPELKQTNKREASEWQWNGKKADPGTLCTALCGGLVNQDWNDSPIIPLIRRRSVKPGSSLLATQAKAQLVQDGFFMRFSDTRYCPLLVLWGQALFQREVTVIQLSHRVVLGTTLTMEINHS